MLPIEKKLGWRIAGLREAPNLTQFELAEAANMGNDFIKQD